MKQPSSLRLLRLQALRRGRLEEAAMQLSRGAAFDLTAARQQQQLRIVHEIQGYTY